MSESSKQNESGCESDPCAKPDAGTAPTIFEQVWTMQERLNQVARSPSNPTPATNEFPEWHSKILERLTKTILKPILKLKPRGTVNWRNYGKMIGLFERYKTFITHDVVRMFEKEGLDKITDQQWEQLEPLLGLDQLRERMPALLGRPVAVDEPLENLIDEALGRQFQHLDNLKSDAFRFLALQSPKTTSLFFKGMAEGYNCFLDVEGGYVGDRGRTRLYLDFLVHRMEIEKYRQTATGKSRHDLQNWVIHETGIRIPADPEWFDHYCDEIWLRMKGVGRKRNGPIL
jgi:hypothetical protein